VIAKHFQPQTLIESSGILYEEGIDPETLADQAQQQPATAQPQPQIAGPQPNPQWAHHGHGNGTGDHSASAATADCASISPQVMAAMQRIKKAIDLLKRDIPRGYRIDIEPIR